MFTVKKFQETLSYKNLQKILSELHDDSWVEIEVEKIFFFSKKIPNNRKVIFFESKDFFSFFSIFRNRKINVFSTRSAHGDFIEVVWTLLPTFILFYLAGFSLDLIQAGEDDKNKFSHLTIKVLGQQWYWNYEYSGFSFTFWTPLEKKWHTPSVKFSSYMVNSDELVKGQFRLLEVDNRLVVPFWMRIRFAVSSADVIHSWAVPALGIKMDAVPGRINQIFSIIQKPGLFFGQCSELCGVNHSFMPIVLESIPPYAYIRWVKNFLSVDKYWRPLNGGLISDPAQVSEDFFYQNLSSFSDLKYNEINEADYFI